MAESASSPALPISLAYSSLRTRSISSAVPGAVRNSTVLPSSISTIPRPDPPSSLSAASSASAETLSFCPSSLRASGRPKANKSASICTASSFIGWGGGLLALERDIAKFLFLCGSDYTLLHELQERQETYDYFRPRFLGTKF